MKEFFAVVFIFAIFSIWLTPSFANAAYAVSSATITKINSGLIASDALTNPDIDTSYWHFGGDAVALGAPYDYHQDSQGLHIGVQAAKSGEWAGYYGVSPSNSAHVYHAVLKIPFNSIRDHWWDTGMYVQTTTPVINYVTCAAVVSSSGITWAVVSTKGNAYQATEFNTLWVDNSANQPTTRDCTMITNGKNLLRVFLDGIQVFSSNTLDLDMPEPFNVFLEAQTSTSSQMLYGAYSDYYSTSDTAVKIVNAPIGGTAKLVDASTNKSLGKDTVDSKGSSSIGIAKFHMPLNAILKVFDSANNLIATQNVGPLWGGDVCKVSYDSTATSAVTQDSTSADGTTHSKHGSWNEKVKMHALPPSLFQ